MKNQAGSTVLKYGVKRARVMGFILCLALSWIMAPVLFGDLVMSIKFQDDASGTTTINGVPTGASTSASLAGTGSSISTGATGIDGAARVENGYLAGGLTGGLVVDNPASTGSFDDYFGTAVSSAAFLLVFKPNWDGAEGNRRFWFDAQNQTGPTSIKLLNAGGASLNIFTRGASGDTNTVTTTSTITWDSDKWYMIGGSYSESPSGGDLVDRTQTVYVRELGDTTGAGTLYLSQVFTGVDPFGTMISSADRPMTIGNRINLAEGMNGQMALFEGETAFYTLNEYDNYFEVITIPEPGAIALLMTGLLVALSLRRAVRR